MVAVPDYLLYVHENDKYHPQKSCRVGLYVNNPTDMCRNLCA